MLIFTKPITVLAAILVLPINANALEPDEIPYPVEMFQTFCVGTDALHGQIVNMAEAMDLQEIEGKYARAMMNPDTSGKVYMVERNPEKRQLLILATTEINTCSLYTQGYQTMNHLDFIRENFDLRTIATDRQGLETREVLVPDTAPESRPELFNKGMYTFSYPDHGVGSIIGYTPPTVAKKVMAQ